MLFYSFSSVSVFEELVQPASFWRCDGCYGATINEMKKLHMHYNYGLLKLFNALFSLFFQSFCFESHITHTWTEESPYL